MQLEIGLSVLGVDQVDDRLVDDGLEIRGLQHPEARGVHLHEAAVGRDRLDALRFSLEDRPDPLGLMTESLLGPPPFGDVGEGANNPGGLLLGQPEGQRMDRNPGEIAAWLAHPHDHPPLG